MIEGSASTAPPIGRHLVFCEVPHGMMRVSAFFTSICLLCADNADWVVKGTLLLFLNEVGVGCVGRY